MNWILKRDKRPTELVSRVILGIGLVTGLVFRLRMYLQDRSLWLDTANLANNVIEKDYQGLWGLLENSQSAPVGFLFLSKSVGSFFDYSELSLIFFPFLFGVAALILFLFLAIELLGLTAAPLAFIPFASCSTAVYYSGEFKQYSADLFCSVLILYVAHRMFKEHFARSWIVAFALVGVFSVWFSHPSIFLLAGTGLGLFLHALKEAKAKSVKALAVSGAVIFIHFLLLYFFQIRPATVGSMYVYWAKGFAPVWPLSLETFAWWYQAILGYVSYPLGFHGYGVWLSLTALMSGVVVCFSKPCRGMSPLLFFPVVLLILFSIFHLYPIATGHHDIYSRLVLFTIPIAFLCIGVGIDGFARLFSGHLFVLLLLGMLLIYSPVSHMIPWPHFPRQEMRPLVAYLHHHISPEDAVYVYHRAVPAFKYYTRHKPIPYIEGTTVEPYELVMDLGQVKAGKRTWAVVSHDFINNRGVIKRELEARYGPVRTKRFPGAWLLLSQSHPTQPGAGASTL